MGDQQNQKIVIEKFNLLGESIGNLQVSDVFKSDISDANKLIKDYIVFFRFNNRQWSASTKNRSEVAHSTKKIRKQKGTGRARAGGITAPQRVGGGRVGTPRPKFNQIKRLNKKQATEAFKIALGDVLQNRSVALSEISMDLPKTSVAANLFKTIGAERRPLIVYGREEKGSIDNFKRSIANIPNACIANALDLNVYDLILCNKMIITEGALVDMMSRIVASYKGNENE